VFAASAPAMVTASVHQTGRTSWRVYTFAAEALRGAG